MSQWTIQIEPGTDGRFQWKHVPVEGEGTPHVSGEWYDSAEEARQAGEAALERHHETPANSDVEVDGYAPPETPSHDEDTRLGESQAALESQEDPRLSALDGDKPVSISSLPLEAQVRAADEEGVGLARN